MNDAISEQKTVRQRLLDAPQLRTRILRQLNIVGMSDADKEDVTQNVLLALLASRAKVQCLESWATVVARRMAYSQLGRRSQHGTVELNAINEPWFSRDPETMIDVRRVLAASAQEERRLVVGRYLEELGLEELAAASCMSRSSVQRHLNSERRRWQKRLAR